MKRPFPSRNAPSSSYVRVNGKIRSREVRVIASDGSQLGVIPLTEALTLARNEQVDLVEVAPNASPPVCRIIDYGKYRYEQAKKEKEHKKHQHANKVKEIQLSPTIDLHDFSVKMVHAIDFLCEDMKVKVTLRFRGREMAHQEYGFQVVQKLINELTPYGHPDAPIRKIGRGINVMISPHPRAKRAKNPRQAEIDAEAAAAAASGSPKPTHDQHDPAHESDDTPPERSEQVSDTSYAEVEDRG